MFDLINELITHDVRMEMSPAKSYDGALLLQFHKDDFHAGYIISADQLKFFKGELAGLFYDFFEKFMDDYDKRPGQLKRINIPNNEESFF